MSAGPLLPRLLESARTGEPLVGVPPGLVQIIGHFGVELRRLDGTLGLSAEDCRAVLTRVFGEDQVRQVLEEQGES